MRIELYYVDGDTEGRLIEDFLKNNEIAFNKIITSDINLLQKICQLKLKDKVSLLKITRSHSINVIIGFNEFELNSLLEHIRKYNPKVEI